MSAKLSIPTQPSELYSEKVYISCQYSWHQYIVCVCNPTHACAVREHNRCHPDKLISSVLCPGLGTAVGRMPFMRCAHQMRTAYNAVIHRNVPAINCPRDLSEPCSAHVQLTRVIKTTSITLCLHYNNYTVWGEFWNQVPTQSHNWRTFYRTMNYQKHFI